MMAWIEDLNWTVKTAAIIAAVTAIFAAGLKLRKWGARWLKNIGHIIRVPPGLVGAIGDHPGDQISQSLKALVKSSNLRKIEAQLIQQKLEMGFYLCAPDGHCLETNPFLDDLFGLPSEQMQGMGWLAAVVEHQKHLVADEWRSSVELQLPYRARYQIQNQRTKKKKWVETAAFAIKEAGVLTGYAGYIHADDDQTDQTFTASFLASASPGVTPTARIRIRKAQKKFLPSENLRLCAQ